MSVSLPIARRLAAACLCATVAGCSIPPKVPEFSGSGTVVSIREVREPGTVATVVGALGGSLIGGIAGADIGGGSGQVAAASVMSVAGGAGGAVLARPQGPPALPHAATQVEASAERAPPGSARWQV